MKIIEVEGKAETIKKGSTLFIRGTKYIVERRRYISSTNKTKLWLMVSFN